MSNSAVGFKITGIRVIFSLLCSYFLAAGVNADDALIKRGELVFNTVANIGCAGCHGAFAEGDLGVGPYIRGASDGSVRAAIEGIGPMVAIKAVITEEETKAVAAYVNYLGAAQVARTQIKRGRFVPDTFATQPGTSMQIVVQNAGFSARSFQSENLGVDGLSVPARSAESFLWQAPEQEGEYSLYCTDCKLKDQLFTIKVDKSARKFIAIAPNVEGTM
jgi:mono/diheme cytochrome c family protein